MVECRRGAWTPAVLWRIAKGVTPQHQGFQRDSSNKTINDGLIIYMVQIPCSVLTLQMTPVSFILHVVMCTGSSKNTQPIVPCIQILVWPICSCVNANTSSLSTHAYLHKLFQQSRSTLGCHSATVLIPDEQQCCTERCLNLKWSLSQHSWRVNATNWQCHAKGLNNLRPQCGKIQREGSKAIFAASSCPQTTGLIMWTWTFAGIACKPAQAQQFSRLPACPPNATL